MTLPLLAVGAVGVIGTATHWCGEIMAELIGAFDKGDHERARELNASLFESYWYESREHAQFALAVKVALRTMGLPAGPCRLPIGPEPAGSRKKPSPCSNASASPPSGRPRHHHLPRRPRRDRSQLHGVRVRGQAPPARLRSDVPRARDARHRPRAAGLHLAARERPPGDRVHRHPRPRGPRGRALVPAPRPLVPGLRLGVHPRPGQEPHRGGRPPRPDAADPRRRRRAPDDRPVRRASSSRSPTRCPTASPRRSTPRRA